MVTIKDIADQLGMSTTTVSNVIHGKTREVSKATIEKVEGLLKELDYVPNINARNLAQNKSKIIGFAMKARPDKYSNLLMDPFVSELVGGVEETVRNAGYFMMIYISRDLNKIMRRVSTWNVDGLLLFGMLNDDGIRVSEKYKNPIVCIDTYSIEGIRHFTNVGLEDEKGGYDMTEYLIKKGHKKIAFISDNQTGVDLARFMGYKRALLEYGIDFKDEDFIQIKPHESEVEGSLGEICEKLKNYTAVFCVSDLYAVMIMAALSDRGVKVPDDISVAGFDDNILGQLHRPALTTVHQDVKGKGVKAATTLLEIMNGSIPENKRITLPTKLIIRNTVAQI